MRSRSGRRGFLGLLGAGTSGALLLGLGREARAQSLHGGHKKKGGPKGQTFSGTSKAGDIEEALDLAIQAALKTAPGADRLVTYTVQEVSGRSGGIAGFRDVTVTIAATIS
jgi:hypothetical protein